MIWPYAALLMLVLAPPVSGTDERRCAALGDDVYEELDQTGLAKEPLGRAREAFRDAVRIIERCPDDENALYVFARAAELGQGEFPVRLRDTQITSAQEATEFVAQRAPSSVRIATVRARTLAGIEVARKAAALDPHYVPAQVALAAALVDGGQADSARTILEALPQLRRVPGGFVLLSRARLKLGDADGALKAALSEPIPPDPFPIEPQISADRTARDAKEMAGMAHLAAGRFDKATRLLLSAAVAGSDRARTALTSEPELRSALSRLGQSGDLSPAERQFAEGLTQAPR